MLTQPTNQTLSTVDRLSTEFIFFTPLDTYPKAQTIIDSMVEGVVLTDSQTRILTVNKAFSTVTGYSKQEVIGRSPRILKSGRHDREFYKNMWQAIRTQGFWQGEIWNRRKNGEVYLENLSVSVVQDHSGKTMNYLGVFSDITQEKISQDRLMYLAYHDSLTGLPNRLLCIDRLKQAIAMAKRQHSIVAVLYLDLDHFKPINDKFGHHVGDLLLQAFAKRLNSFVRAEDSIARLGGDEFLIIFVNLADRQRALELAEEIHDSMTLPFSINQSDYHIGLSIGISIFPKDGEDAEELVQAADRAMLQAKRLGCGISWMRDDAKKR